MHECVCRRAQAGMVCRQAGVCGGRACGEGWCTGEHRHAW